MITNKICFKSVFCFLFLLLISSKLFMRSVNNAEKKQCFERNISLFKQIH